MNIRLLLRYRKVVVSLLRQFKVMEDALRDGYVTREEASRVGYAVEAIYREWKGLRPRENDDG